MDTWAIPLLLGLVLGAALRRGFRAWQRRRSQALRRVELPNSAYSAPGVRHQEDRVRWGRIDLHGLHPLNRDEVVRLLALADREGHHALSPGERLFLDNMTLPRMG